jgi:NAD(P)-dependent dehydrogenase (short-subunit alcohol dehydrogenase family)
LSLQTIGIARLGRKLTARSLAVRQPSYEPFAETTSTDRCVQRAKNSAGAGGTDILMNNAGIQPGSQMFGPHENWQRILSVDLWGVINGSQVFAPQIIARGLPGSGTADLANQRSGDHSTWSR